MEKPPAPMFRFIHAADLHLDSPLRGLEAYEGAPVETIRAATRRALENLVALALEEAADFVVIAGDVYDGDWKDHATGLFFRGQMVRLEAAGIPVCLISGNHDAESVLTRQLSLPANVHRFSARAAGSFEVPGLPVVVHGQSFPNRAVAENLVPGYPEAVRGKFNLGLLHTSLTGLPGHDTYAPCSLRDLEEKGYDYWALGHIHQPAELSREPWIIFSGNVQGRHARETGPRGCRLVTVTEALEVESVEFRELDVVRWALVHVEAGGVEKTGELFDRIDAALRTAVCEAGGRLLAARIILSGATALHGWLHREADSLRAECVALAQSAGGPVWIEEVKVATSSVYDTAELASRDSLTGLVVESLDRAGTESLDRPAEVEDLLKVLPKSVRAGVEDLMTGEAKGELLAEVRAIILDALATRGGEV